MEQERRRALGGLTHKLSIGKIDLQLLDIALTHPSYAMEHHLSAEAKRYLREMGLSERDMRGKVDCVAASIFLQTWLAQQRR